MLSEERIKRIWCECKSIDNRAFAVEFARAIEAAARAELLAEAGELPEPAKAQHFICTKCGMHGAGSGAFHSRPDGTTCNYLAHSEGPYYTADQMRAGIAAARAEQRESDAASLDAAAEALAPVGKRSNQIDRHTADVLRSRADVIREGGEA